MTTEQIIVLSEAVQEFKADGLVSTTTFIALTNSGLDAEATIETIEESYNG